VIGEKGDRVRFNFLAAAEAHPDILYFFGEVNILAKPGGMGVYACIHTGNITLP